MLRLLEECRSGRSNQYNHLLEALGLPNIFNPSFVHWNGCLYVTFRAIPENNTKIHAYILICDETHQENHLIDLTKHYAPHGILRVADPKLFIFNAELWVTFNTGWAHEGNSLYIAKVAPHLGPPLRCIFDGAQRIEKNWAFYGKSEKLYAIHSLDPGKVLCAADKPRNDGTLPFTVVGLVYSKDKMASYTIGSQLAWNKNEAYLVAHRKITVLGKRLYLGRLMKVILKESDAYIYPIRDYMFHSWRSLIGNRIKHNKNLISCTYFSGLYIENETLHLGYGINDITFNFAEIKLENLL